MEGQIHQSLCCTIDGGVLGSMFTRCASNVHSATAVFHAISSRLSKYTPLHRTPVAHITTLYSPHITQHGKVCVCVKLRGPLLKQASQRQLPATQRRPMHYSRSFTQPPICLSWVHHTFPTARCTMKETRAHCTEIHQYCTI